MLVQNLSNLFERDLNKLIEEIQQYKDEYDIWKTTPGINNSGGNLCLHLIGNLNHFIGAVLGNTGYIRHRDNEFSQKNILRDDLILNIKNCILIIKSTFDKLTDADLEKNFPLEKHGEVVSNQHMLLHLFGHLNYHLGQINYHRRMIG
ncbi:MAG: DinB family protein [Ferruginibacter sp.]|nr:DinB family protein [Bacteroidota bacterium]MBX2919401.1 DinB family protein [Ferruginibacter sp.]MCB0708086.1 DinB family protein [Chitinophagaceae bacterium]MCC7377815.1 DinB family protein [Chitinophagaceae bacterium]